MGKAVNAALNIEVNPTVAGVFEEVVFLCEFVGNVAEFDSDVLWTVKRGVKVEVADVEGGKLCAGTREDAVEEEFGQFKGISWGANISEKENVVAADRDAHAVGILFFREDFENHFGVSDFFAAVGGDIFEAGEEEGIGVFDAFARAVGRGTNALAEPAEFFGV